MIFNPMFWKFMESLFWWIFGRPGVVHVKCRGRSSKNWLLRLVIRQVVAKVNVDDHQELAGKYGIMSIPALLVFKDGEVVENLVGVHQKSDLMEVIEKYR